MKNKIICTIIISLNILTTNIFAQSNYPGFDVIGKGYDVFGEYANNKSIVDYPIFDFSKMKRRVNSENESVPVLISVKNASNHIIKTVEGSSKKEYIENLSKEAGLSLNAFFFKGSFEHQFNKTSTQSSNHLYYTYMDVNTKWKVSLDIRNKDSLINHLDNQFKSDLETISPKELFELYGTHYISNAYLGGRIDYSTTTEINESITKTDVKNAINAQLNSIKGSIEWDDKTKNTYKQITTSTKLNIVGGNSEFTNNINNHTQYLKWAEGIKKTPVLSGFDDKSLRPIWELTKNVTRQNELKSYFTTSILSKYPLPLFFKKDDVLDNKELTKKLNVLIRGFQINKDCDGADEDGDFQYHIRVYSNGKLIEASKTKEGRVHKVWSGNFLAINKNVQIEVPLKSNSNIRIEWKLTEIDRYTSNEIVGNNSKTHLFPFSAKDLYNRKNQNNNYYWEAPLFHSNECNAVFSYQIKPIQNKTATEFGNNGWYAFEKNNFDDALSYSREALKLDNTLWYAHYNVALVYLIQGNPRAFDKYKHTTSLCDNKRTINGALQDILDYESKNGEIQNSNSVKLWLRSKI